MRYLEPSDSDTEGWLPGAGGGGGREVLFNVYRVFVLQEENVLEVCCTTM